MNLFIVEQLPVIPPAAYSRAFGPKTAADIVRENVLALTYTAHDMAPFARDMGHIDPATGDVLPPFAWNPADRLRRRAKLDALFLMLYFPSATPADLAVLRDTASYIYSTFPIVEREERAAHARYLSRDHCLATINALVAGDPDAVIVLQIARLKAEHAQTITPAQSAATKAVALEKQLSTLVNTAYGLTPEEEALMWATAPPRMPFVP